VQESPDGERRDVVLEEDDEVSEEEDEFDINDSSPEAATSVSKKISNALTVEEEILGQEKARDTVMESTLHKAVTASVVRGDRRRKSKSRSRSRSSGLHSGVDSPSRFADPKPHPPIHSPRRIDFVLEAPDISESEHMDVSRSSSGRVILDSRKAPSRSDRSSTERDPDVETIKTPTVSTVRGKIRGQTRSRSVDYHGRRAFAFWGHDDSDSNDDSSA
jgi:NAD+ kinase